MHKLNGLETAAIHPQGEEERNMGVPTHWNTYITTPDVDAVVEKAGQTGGNMLFNPKDIFKAGRMAMFQEPPGAAFAVWQPKERIGIKIKHDPESAIQLYNVILGMKCGQDMEPANYTLLQDGARTSLASCR